jgi:DNA repair protein RAD50
MARGSLGTVRDGIQRAKDNLSAKEFRDIDTHYRKQLIELKTTEMAASDLDKYHKARLRSPSFWNSGRRFK